MLILLAKCNYKIVIIIATCINVYIVVHTPYKNIYFDVYIVYNCICCTYAFIVSAYIMYIIKFIT